MPRPTFVTSSKPFLYLSLQYLFSFVYENTFVDTFICITLCSCLSVNDFMLMTLIFYHALKCVNLGPILTCKPCASVKQVWCRRRGSGSTSSPRGVTWWGRAGGRWRAGCSWILITAPSWPWTQTTGGSASRSPPSTARSRTSCYITNPLSVGFQPPSLFRYWSCIDIY